jgi:HK97 family phage prohead protease
MYEIKNISGAITDVDAKSSTVKGYFSVFNNKDSDNDVILPGAYTKSLKENGQRVLHLYQHDPMRPLSSVKSGKLILKEDNHGLAFESTISPTSWGKDVIQLIQDGVLNENSVGFRTVKSLDKKDYRELVELKLFEGSSVSWGANPEAVIVKSELNEDFLTTKMNTVLKAVRDGNYTDETAAQLEIYILQLNQLFLDAKATKPVLQETAKPATGEKTIQVVKGLNNLFKTHPRAAERKEELRKQAALLGRLIKRA